MNKWVKRIVGSLLGLYLLALTVLYFSQETFFFNGSPLPEDYLFRDGEEVELEVAEDIFLNCLLIDEPTDKGVILYLHGNKGSNSRCLRQVKMFEDLGYDLFMPDYRGYGKSDGKMTSQKQAYSDVQVVYDHLEQQYGEANIVILGYSLGSAMASHLAAHNNPKSLHLVAPFLSLTHMKDKFVPVIPDFLIKYPFSNKANLKEVNCPVTLYHSHEDELIPYQHSEDLVISNKVIQLINLPGAGHRGSIFHSAVRANIE